MATLRELGLHLIIYRDDTLIMEETESLLRDHITAVIYLLENLGFVAGTVLSAHYTEFIFGWSPPFAHNIGLQ